MKYMGSKNRIAKYILPIILKDRKEGQFYVEPFMGGCNLIDKVTGNRIASDINEYIVELLKELLSGWTPPNLVTEEQYKEVKNNKENYPKHLVGFYGIFLTFGSTWFGTFARNKRNTNYAIEGRKNLLKQIKNLQGTKFVHSSYNELEVPRNSIIYCDPPYEGVAGYKDKFNHAEFWEWCRKMKKIGHTVFVSEYKAPEDFICVWEKNIDTNMNAGIMKKSTEKLFTL